MSAKPTVVVSRCLEFAPVRYDGQIIESPVVRRLKRFVKFVPICPEMEIGLGVPRPKIRLVENGQSLTLWQPSSGRDLTLKIRNFSRSFLTSLEEVDGFILKSRSPSCGIRGTKIFSNGSDNSHLRRGQGFFAEAVLRAYPAVAIEDEDRLLDPDRFDHFLTKLFAVARCRHVKSRISVPLLNQFHTENQLLYRAYNMTEQRYLNLIVQAASRNPCEMLRSEYERHFHHLIFKRPRYTSHAKVMEEIVALLWHKIRSRDKPIIKRLLNRYRNRDLPLSPLRMAMRELVLKFGDADLKRQTYLKPYPVELELIPER
ncbi:MAG: DUF523 and DUF1722 domain-containing protein [bacterium]|nr:DUF523 and DUF1722 domain-containing protein [bacterium]